LGAPRIHAELLKLGIDIGEASASHELRLNYRRCNINVSPLKGWPNL